MYTKALRARPQWGVVYRCGLRHQILHESPLDPSGFLSKPPWPLSLKNSSPINICPPPCWPYPFRASSIPSLFFLRARAPCVHPYTHTQSSRDWSLWQGRVVLPLGGSRATPPEPSKCIQYLPDSLGPTRDPPGPPRALSRALPRNPDPSST